MTRWYPCKLCGDGVSEFDYIFDPDIQACAICTKFINTHQDSSGYTTPPVKIVEKEWGREEWLANSPLYCSKILHITRGKGTSVHHHERKTETMRVLTGKFRIFIEDEILFMTPGDILNISPYQIHKIDAVRSYHDNPKEPTNQLLEVSTQHFDSDSIRHGRDLLKYISKNKKSQK